MLREKNQSPVLRPIKSYKKIPPHCNVYGLDTKLLVLHILYSILIFTYGSKMLSHEINFACKVDECVSVCLYMRVVIRVVIYFVILHRIRASIFNIMIERSTGLVSMTENQNVLLSSI